jgi:rhodanese-related sulfurtransferase
MRKLWYFLVIAIALSWISLISAPASDTTKVPRISKEKVKAMLGKPNVIVVDVRVKPDWEKSGHKIKGAIREDPKTVEKWYSRFPKNKALIFYCA